MSSYLSSRAIYGSLLGPFSFRYDMSYVLCIMTCLLVYDKVNNKAGKLLTYLMDDVTDAGN